MKRKYISNMPIEGFSKYHICKNGRLYSLYNLLDKYQSLTSYPKLDSRAKIAFLQVKRDIESGQYSAEDMKNVFKLKDENRDK